MIRNKEMADYTIKDSEKQFFLLLGWTISRHKGMIDIARRCGMETVVRKVDREHGYE